MANPRASAYKPADTAVKMYASCVCTVLPAVANHIATFETTSAMNSQERSVDGLNPVCAFAPPGW